MNQTIQRNSGFGLMDKIALPIAIVAPLIYIILCAMIGALLAYPLHFIFPASFEYQALVYKSAELLMALSLFPLGRWVGMGKADIGLVGPIGLLLRQIAKGFGWGALMLGIHVLVLIILDVRLLYQEKLYLAKILSLSYKGVLIGLAVASLEEPIFRGFLFGYMLKKTNFWKAALVASFYFAALHFLSTDLNPEFSDIRWNTGFIIVLDAFKNLFDMHFDSFLALFAAGVFLSVIRLYFSDSGLSYCIGIHAGWVFVIKATKPLSEHSVISPYTNFVSDFDGNIGYLSATWTTLLTVLLINAMKRQVEYSSQTAAIIAVTNKPASLNSLGEKWMIIKYWLKQALSHWWKMHNYSINNISKINLAIGSVLLLTLIRLLLAGKTELIPEESYYWAYSQHPALSYFDHPPMVAWMISIGTAIFGNTELGVRVVAILLWPFSALLLFSTGKLWFDEKIAAIAVLLFCLCPVFVGVGFIVTPDFPLVFFWLLTMNAVSRALLTHRNGFWLLAGIAFGCAMLSKYTAVMLSASLFLFLLASPKHRFWLLRLQPWLALLVALVVFSPVIIWNSQHQWASFLFQSNRTEVGNNDPLRVEAGMFWLYQLWALTPFIFGLFIYTLVPAIRRAWTQREVRCIFTMSFALPLYLVFVLASFKTKGHINWTAPAYLSWSLAAAAIFWQLDKTWLSLRPIAWRCIIAATVLIAIAANTLVHTSLAWGFPQKYALKSAGGWQGLASAVGKAREELSQNTGKPAFILGMDKYNIAAEMGFYLQEPVDIVNDYALGSSGLGYRYWVDLKNLEGRPAIAILDHNKIGPYSILWLQQHFEKLDEWIPMEIQGDGLQKRKVYLVRAYGYKI